MKIPMCEDSSKSEESVQWMIAPMSEASNKWEFQWVRLPMNENSHE